MTCPFPFHFFSFSYLPHFFHPSSLSSLSSSSLLSLPKLKTHHPPGHIRRRPLSPPSPPLSSPRCRPFLFPFDTTLPFLFSSSPLFHLFNPPTHPTHIQPPAQFEQNSSLIYTRSFTTRYTHTFFSYCPIRPTHPGGVCTQHTLVQIQRNNINSPTHLDTVFTPLQQTRTTTIMGYKFQVLALATLSIWVIFLFIDFRITWLARVHLSDLYFFNRRDLIFISLFATPAILSHLITIWGHYYRADDLFQESIRLVSTSSVKERKRISIWERHDPWLGYTVKYWVLVGVSVSLNLAWFVQPVVAYLPRGMKFLGTYAACMGRFFSLAIGISFLPIGCCSFIQFLTDF